ncbi:DJ-1/PfpI family protein [Streptomyces sp. P38-E01]|uniref:DJ-1/PfpI family protein n=1 Tax=Streptomyces tardus TaxID=2780544 RepID=A0A949NBA3_9ACTN|nr:DJ-1/PfpI family protein [Streptomyces tardus]MBU7600663.1 DJ-1/PfpI family protein [Streptomyces tardus]
MTFAELPAEPTVAIVLYPGFTSLDAVGPYETLSNLPGARTVFVAARPGPVTNDGGALTLVAGAGFEEVPRPDVVVVPGGPPENVAAAREDVVPWLRAVDPYTTVTASVCTGSLLLADAGLLEGRRATTHWLVLEHLATLGCFPVSERVVTDGKYVTAAGVSAGIDMGLGLAAELAGERVAQRIQLMIEYDPAPPFRAGSPATAPAEIVQELREVGLGL